jgi:hypothetical protein
MNFDRRLSLLFVVLVCGGSRAAVSVATAVAPGSLILQANGDFMLQANGDRIEQASA